MFANEEAAKSYVDSLPKADLALRQFLARAMMSARMRAAAGDSPGEPFDLLFFVKTMVDLFEQRANLARIIAGEDLRWWSDDDEEG